MNHPFMQLLVRWAVLALGVVIATKLISGIHCDDATALIVVVLLLSFFNAILKPILVLFTLPFILVTMGLGVVVINALLFLLVARLVDGFEVSGFWAALGGSLVVSITNFVVSRLLRPKPGATTAPTAPGHAPRSSKRGKPDDVIDI
jgi:putative membrane protein